MSWGSETSNIPRKKAFGKRGELMRGQMKLELKKRILNTLIWSTVLYAAETRTIPVVECPPSLGGRADWNRLKCGFGEG